MHPNIIVRFATLLLASVLLAAAPVKLMLTDGSYHLVRSYERVGDRVKFYSIERDAWEELPASLVDWKATETAAKTETERDAAEARKIGREIAAERVANHGSEIAPAVRLPDEAGVYAYYDGKVITLPISRAGTQTDKSRKVANILLPAPVLKDRKLVTLPGAKSATRFAMPPSLYVVGTAKEPSRYFLLRIKVKGDHREVEALSTWALGNSVSHDLNQVELVEEVVDDDTIRLVPRMLLAPGEYAVVELIDQKLNLYVADFGIDP